MNTMEWVINTRVRLLKPLAKLHFRPVGRRVGPWAVRRLQHRRELIDAAR
jgi:hypothetical protein